MKKLLLSAVIGITAPATALAQTLDVLQSSDSYAYASVFAGNFSLLLSIVIGIIATFIVFRAARKLGGGLFGSVLNYVGIGMVFIVLGSIVAVINPWFSGFWAGIGSTAFFAFGYIFMVIGDNKLFKGIMNI
jgi:hypothetical protein